jgi:hypothetical protein
MNQAARVIPFPKQSAEPPKPRPKTLPHPDQLRSRREEREAAQVAWAEARDDIKGSGLEPRVREVLLILAHLAPPRT